MAHLGREMKRILTLIFMLFASSAVADYDKAFKERWLKTAEDGMNAPGKIEFDKTERGKVVEPYGKNINQFWTTDLGPFGIMYWDDSAGGGQMAVELLAPTMPPWDPNWTEQDRVWIGAGWSSNPNAFLFSTDGRYLYVSTDDVYGDASVYELDLVLKTSKRIFHDAKSEPRIVGFVKEGLEIKLKNEERVREMCLPISKYRRPEFNLKRKRL